MFRRAPQGAHILPAVWELSGYCSPGNAEKAALFVAGLPFALSVRLFLLLSVLFSLSGAFSATPLKEDSGENA